jgi:hypothetical protein
MDMKSHNVYSKYDEQIQDVVTKVSTKLHALKVRNIFKLYTHPN